MATYDITKGSGAPSALTTGKTFSIYRDVDFTTATYLTGDVLNVINVPAKSYVSVVGFEVLTAEGAVFTASIGDSVNATGYVSSVNGNAIGSGTSGPFAGTVNAASTSTTEPLVTTGFSGGKFYPAADTIKVTLNNSPVKAKIRVFCILHQITLA